ncbi:MAG: thaumatin domain-containing protein, partial [Alphaproteobacteria bacterium]|nr:thaumatin domain-containing protein [Alphaproteobacteria bacterium]
FVNECDFKVWFSMNGGAIGNSPDCTTDAQCPDGTSCDPAANGGKGVCFWINPTPPSHPANNPVNPYELEAFGGVNTNSVMVPVASNAVDVNTQWSGNISASALCNGSTSCEIADCNNNGGSASCAVGNGFDQPATQFEITMIKSDRDFYDVEVINGFHMPIQVTPNNPFNVPGDDFNCGTPGNPAGSPGYGLCNWNNAIPPSPKHAYYWVSSGGPECTTTCTGGKLCGLDNKLNRVCGDFQGFWSADQACAVNANKAQEYFQCKNFLTNPPYPSNTYQLSALYGCVTPSASESILNSCYIFDAPDCCGCANWDQFGITIPASTLACKNTSNLNWTQQVQPKIQWMKATCPSYYTYPYDDASSSFRCSDTAAGNSNSVGYTITFCPGGNTGLPNGAPEGRG